MDVAVCNFGSDLGALDPGSQVRCVCAVHCAQKTAPNSDWCLAMRLAGVSLGRFRSTEPSQTLYMGPPPSGQVNWLSASCSDAPVWR
eukprot:7586262-Pyramimonas_sp.AAC.1